MLLLTIFMTKLNFIEKPEGYNESLARNQERKREVDARGKERRFELQYEFSMCDKSETIMAKPNVIPLSQHISEVNELFDTSKEKKTTQNIFWGCCCSYSSEYVFVCLSVRVFSFELPKRAQITISKLIE